MGGLYNMIYGWNPACVLIAPMLTDENPQDFFPRFRDCFIGNDEDSIVIYTRVGGGNRSYTTSEPYEPTSDFDEDWSYGEDKLYRMPTFKRTWDDSSDTTYGFYEFGVPDEWRADFEHIKAWELDQISEAYVDRMQGCYPKLDIKKLLQNTMSKEANDGK